MRTYPKIVQCFAVLSDPTNPDRKPAFDVHVLTMIDLEDGSPPFVDPRVPLRVLTMKQARAEGLDLPEIAKALATDAMADAEETRRDRDRHRDRADRAERQLRALNKSSD